MNIDQQISDLKVEKFKIHRLGEETLLAMARHPYCKCWDKTGSDHELQNNINWKGFFNSLLDTLDAYEEVIKNLESKSKDE